MNLVRGNHQFIVSLYRLDLEDEIFFDPSAGPDFGFGPTGANVNLDDTKREGVTLSWIAQVGMDLAITTELGYVNAKFESGIFDGNDISGVSDKIASLRGDYNINDYFSVYAETNYSSERYAQGDNGNAFGKEGSITVINAGIGYHYKTWDVNFRVNNLNDEEYAEFITNNGFGAAFQPSPDRNYLLTASYSFE